LATLVAFFSVASAFVYDFYNTDEDVRYTKLEIHNPIKGAPTALTFEFTLNIPLVGGDVIAISMPGFTRSGAAAGSWLIRDDFQAGPDILTPLGQVHNGGNQLFDEEWAKHFDIEYGGIAKHHTLHSIFSLRWKEGNNGPDVVYPKNWMNGTLYLQIRPDRFLPPDDLFKFTIRESAGFSTLCGIPRLNGFPETEQGHWYSNLRDEVDIGIRGIVWATNSSKSTGSSTTLMYSTQVGNGCVHLNWCSGHGYCDFCRERCDCERTHGGDNSPKLGQMNALKHSTGTLKYDCSEQTCPVGRSTRALPTSDVEAHTDAECSDNGICDRGSGQCECFMGWEGEACDRRKCPNDCSGHGRCFSMTEMVKYHEALPLNDNMTIPLGAQSKEVEYGTLTGQKKWAWDGDMMTACICDSSWAVGLYAGETQQPEWFGPDCSLRRCPSGDDPTTKYANETDGGGVLAEGGRGVGKPGNALHVDCSNLGICNHNTGVCDCFKGYETDNCGTESIITADHLGGAAPTPKSFYSS
jgi:hypothetical protein